jgi:hypothetical protein
MYPVPRGMIPVLKKCAQILYISSLLYSFICQIVKKTVVPQSEGDTKGEEGVGTTFDPELEVRI